MAKQGQCVFGPGEHWRGSASWSLPLAEASL
ncbi:hypothetical protein A2U01_0119148, partial [Trifolium medium]|nr:hypothetical protein [Trifolium medium]